MQKDLLVVVFSCKGILFTVRPILRFELCINPCPLRTIPSLAGAPNARAPGYKQGLTRYSKTPQHSIETIVFDYQPMSKLMPFFVDTTYINCGFGSSKGFPPNINGLAETHKFSNVAIACLFGSYLKSSFSNSGSQASPKKEEQSS